MLSVKYDADWLKRCMKTEFEGTRQRGRPRKTLWDCVKADMESFGLSREYAQDRDYCRLRIKGNRLTQVYLESSR